jgi:hypothetical protein
MDCSYTVVHSTRQHEHTLEDAPARDYDALCHPGRPIEHGDHHTLSREDASKYYGTSAAPHGSAVRQQLAHTIASTSPYNTKQHACKHAHQHTWLASPRFGRITGISFKHTVL